MGFLDNMYNENNFYKHTQAVFKGCKVPRRQPDYVSYDQYGEVSFKYWYNKRGVIRQSNHWCFISTMFGDRLEARKVKTIASCFWGLKNTSPNKGYNNIACGFCPWDKFTYVLI